jgi:wyosine [tRNA(Phe)-imidazoG37] synthetase (radical SAM superfamily)
MKYIYGPLKSRRLGNSLGVSLTPQKTCNFDCIYCQLGRTACLTDERKAYVKTVDIIHEFKAWLRNNSQAARDINFVTISGAGEPTLSSAISEVISGIKQLSGLPVAVITNASLLHIREVRSALLAADLIVPSLDAVSQGIFIKIDRPIENVKVEEIISGLVALRKEFKGQIWLEVMIVAGVNDDLRQIRMLKEAVDRIEPDKIQINSPVRAAAEKDILAADKKRLEEIREILGDKCEVV